jgi:energy-coupling factor transporter ATP-binding protein EcfA2
MPHSKTNINQYKSRLSDYLDHKGITKKQDRYSCVSSQHADNDPSASVYDNGGDNKLNCNSCGFKGDIFDCAGEIIGMAGQEHFQDQLKEIQSVFGGGPLPMKPAQKKTAKKSEIKVVPLSHDKALEKFSPKRILELCSGVMNGFGNKALSEDHKDFRVFLEDNTTWFPYYDAGGKIDLMVVRLEDQHRKKEVLTYYWNGENVAMKAYPILIYGRDQLKKFPNLPVLIHEGEKCVKAANKKLPGFVHVGWNGGGKKFMMPDWSALKGREVFLLPDDDAPGIKTMHNLSLLLKGDHGITAYEVPIFPKAKKIKKKGADIEEILQCYSPEEITKTIFNLRSKDEGDTDTSGTDGSNRNANNSNRLNVENTGNVSAPSDDRCPFKILGIADDGRAYFLNYESRLLNYELETLTEKKLINLAGLKHFKDLGVEKKDDWMHEIDEIMQFSNRMDFNMENIRGRGAWKDSEGNICYHDGKSTIGKYDPEWTFIRKPQKKIGINEPHTDFGTRSEIIKTAHNFSFSTPADCVRLLSWAALAPFSGALSWRVAFLLTGESGTGKSTLMNIVRKISMSLTVNGGSTTEAAIRQFCGNDSGSTIVDEAESKSHRDRERVEGQFALMRASTTDDSPKTLKGSINGTATPFEMRQMFGFIAINASVDNVADDNRITRINTKKTEDHTAYVDSKKRIDELLTIENCEGIRSFTWNNLSKIIGLSTSLNYIIQKVTGQDQRYADSESILLAANMIVWENLRGNEDDDFLTEYITDFYRDQTQEEKRDETGEMITKILDQTALVDIEENNVSKKITMSFRELLSEMRLFLRQRLAQKEGDYTNNMTRIETINRETYRNYKRIVEQKGLSVHTKSMELAIVQNHEEIKKVLGLGNGYHRQLERHKNQIHKNHGTNIDGTTKRCTIITGFLEHVVDEE